MGGLVEEAFITASITELGGGGGGFVEEAFITASITEPGGGGLLRKLSSLPASLGLGWHGGVGGGTC